MIYTAFKKEKKEKKNILRGVLILFLVTISFVALNAVSKVYFSKFGGSKICAQNQCFKIEIADTPKTREIGLMKRTSLDEDKGMLFVFPQSAVYSFRMKNTLISLDMLRMDENYKIIYVQDSAQPCAVEPCMTYGPMANANYVLELNGGTAEKLGLQVGEKLIFHK